MEYTECIGFDWDDDNLYKNIAKHAVYGAEIEQVFFNTPVLVRKDTEHSAREQRFYVLGHTDSYRLLFAAFTIRGNLIRVNSARDMTSREMRVYEEFIKRDTSF